MNTVERNDKKIEALEMWLYRRMLKVSWIEHVTNAEILRRMLKGKNLISVIFFNFTSK
jgi:hypothetical protein